jgi:L-ascorbate metabolism protein UlaG (beta-lactamase superfamily)
MVDENLATPRTTIAIPSRADDDLSRHDLEFVGTATVILRFAGYTILTDPNFLHQGEHAYLGMGLRSRRRTQPSRDETNLPPIDMVVLSHHHGDHFDRRAASGLSKDLPIVTEPHAARKLSEQGFKRTVSLRTWERQEFEKGGVRLTITALPGKHAPRALAPVIPPVMGSMLDFDERSRQPLRVYITGDTLMHDRLEEIPRRFPAIDLCLLHLGGTRILGVLLTMDAAQGVELLQLVGPDVAIPIHFDDYPVFRSNIADFQRAAAAASLRTQIRYVQRGETVPVGR